MTTTPQKSVHLGKKCAIYATGSTVTYRDIEDLIGAVPKYKLPFRREIFSKDH